MSYELLLLAGPNSPAGQERRRQRIEHAGARVPGAVRTRWLETDHVVVALIETHPDGGCWGRLDDQGGVISAAVSTTAPWDERRSHGSISHDAGAERGHVLVEVRPHAALSVRTDGVGMVPTFWGQTADGLILSTHLSTMVSLGLSPEPDVVGCLQYLTLLHPLDERTILRHAGVMPPGGVLTWTPGSAPQLTSHPLFVPGPACLDDDVAVDAFRDVWFDVMRDLRDRTAERRVAVGLSGGLDSRAILNGAVGSAIACSSYSFGADSDREVRIARTVAERLGVAHVTLPVTDSHVLADVARSTLDVDGAHSPALLYDSWFREELAQMADVIINGHGGGPVWGDEKAFGLSQHDEVLAHVWRRMLGPWTAVRVLLTADAEGEQALRDSVDSSLRAWDVGSQADMVMFWNLANRQRRWGNMLVSMLRRSGLVVETPFLDNRVLRHSASLTAEQHRNGRLYPEVHRRLFTTTADIPRSDDGNAPQHLNHLYWTGDASVALQLSRLGAAHPASALRLLARRGARQAAAEVRRRTSWTRPSDHLERRATVFPIELWSRTRPAYRQRLADFLDAGTGHHLLLSAGAMQQAAESLRRGESDVDPVALSKAATLGVWAADHHARARALGPLDSGRSASARGT